MKTELYRYEQEGQEIIVYYDDEFSYDNQSTDAINYFEEIQRDTNPYQIDYDSFNRPLYVYFHIAQTGLDIKITSVYLHQDYDWNLKEQIKEIV